MFLRFKCDRNRTDEAATCNFIKTFNLLKIIAYIHDSVRKIQQNSRKDQR